jgi:tRNA A37 threonylcarbamoyladenosine modification protein TsaB
MRLLLIDTCGNTGSVALADTAYAAPIYATATLPGRTASERLVATIRDLAATNNTMLH